MECQPKWLQSGLPHNVRLGHMLAYLWENKWFAAAVLGGLAIFIGLIDHWSARNALDARTDLMHGQYASALEKYKRSADKGDPTAQNSLGNIYYLGLGVDRDYERAAHWYERAAINGNEPALVNMGILYFQGNGVKRDLLKAFAWFRLGEKANRKSAETHMKYLAGINLITPNMIQKAKELYHDVASLTSHTDTGLESFKTQPHLPTSENDRRIQKIERDTVEQSSQ